MKLFGHPWSLNTRKVLMTFAEKGQHAELVSVALPSGEHLLPAHLARHPFGKVPVLEDGALVLFESRAITAYLDRRLEGPRLTPDDLADAARVEQWIAAVDAYLAPHAGVVVLEAIFRKYLPGETPPDVLARAKASLDAPLGVLDAALRDGRHLAGDAFTRADIHLMPYVDFLVRAGEGERIASRPHLAAWWKRVSERPTWHAVARTGPQP